MITVHGRPNSSNVAKVMWTLAELGVPHRRLDVGGNFAGNTDASYLALNPNGLIPLLVDGETTVWESNAIVRYLGAAYGKDGFWAEDAGKRSQADRWMDWGTIYLYPKVIALMQAKTEDALEKAIAEAEGLVAILDGALANTAFLAGEGLTMADIAVGIHLGRLFRLTKNKFDQPNLGRSFQALSSRPDYERHCLRALA